MPTADDWCGNCALYTDGEVVCARCGQTRVTVARKATRPTGRPSLSVPLAIFSGLLIAVPTLIVWGFANEFIMSMLMGNAPYAVDCGEHLFGIYATVATRAYAVGLAVVTVLLCAGAIYASVRLTRAGNPGLAVMLLLIAFLGLAPATMCDASTLYTCP